MSKRSMDRRTPPVNAQLSGGAPLPLLRRCVHLAEDLQAASAIDRDTAAEHLRVERSALSSVVMNERLLDVGRLGDRGAAARRR